MSTTFWSYERQVVWKEGEIWLERELLHFCQAAVAKKIGFKGRVTERLSRVFGRAKGSSPTPTPTPTPLTPPSEPPLQTPKTLKTVSLTPLGSTRYPCGTIEVHNATEVSDALRVASLHQKCYHSWSAIRSISLARYILDRNAA